MGRTAKMGLGGPPKGESLGAVTEKALSYVLPIMPGTKRKGLICAGLRREM